MGSLDWMTVFAQLLMVTMKLDGANYGWTVTAIPALLWLVICTGVTGIIVYENGKERASSKRIKQSEPNF